MCLLKKRIDWVLMLIGSYMVSYGVFNFSIEDGTGILQRYSIDSEKTRYAYGYYYNNGAQQIIAFGAVFLVFGILLYRQKSKTKDE